jgi:hypothetical protein
VNHGQTWKGWERSGEKGLIISDNQVQTWLIITINDTSIGDLPLIITISDTCKNQPKRLDFDNSGGCLIEENTSEGKVDSSAQQSSGTTYSVTPELYSVSPELRRSTSGPRAS